MISSLRKKLLLLSTLSVTVVVTLVFVTLNFFYYNSVTSRSNEVLNKIANDDKVLMQIMAEGTENGKRGIVSSDKVFFNAFFVVQLDDNKEVINTFNRDVHISTDDVIRYANDAVKQDELTGYTQFYKFKYIEKSYGKFIVFADCERELYMFNEFLKNSVIVALLLIVLISVFIGLLSRKVIAPIEENYKKQKQFITDASHELKTPLTIISSNADVLEMELGNSKWLNNIHNQIERMTHLINSLVAFSRAEERESLQLSKFSLSELVNSRLDDFSELASFKSKEIVSNVQEDIYYVGDSQSIMQVIDILLDNAIKYADDNSKIYLDLHMNKKTPNLIIKNKAEIAKQGDLSKVFDRFYRLDESRNSQIKGYGIGLSLAKLILDKHKSTAKAYAPVDGEFVIDIKFNEKQK